MSGDRDYPASARHAKPEAVGRRGLLKVGLIAGAAVIPGSATAEGIAASFRAFILQ